MNVEKLFKIEGEQKVKSSMNFFFFFKFQRFHGKFYWWGFLKGQEVWSFASDRLFHGIMVTVHFHTGYKAQIPRQSVV